jgi:aspartate aminotransferase
MVQHHHYLPDLRANHFGVFRDSGLEVKLYRYYDKKNINLDLDGMVEDIKVFALAI